MRIALGARIEVEFLPHAIVLHGPDGSVSLSPTAWVTFMQEVKRNDDDTFPARVVPRKS